MLSNSTDAAHLGKMKEEEKNAGVEQRSWQSVRSSKKTGVFSFLFTYLSLSGSTWKGRCPHLSRGAVSAPASFLPLWTHGPAVAHLSSQVRQGSSSQGPLLPGPHGCHAGWPGVPLTGNRCTSCRGWELGASARCTGQLTMVCRWP